MRSEVVEVVFLLLAILRALFLVRAADAAQDGIEVGFGDSVGQPLLGEAVGLPLEVAEYLACNMPEPRSARRKRS
jgi:hypothetical protein